MALKLLFIFPDLSPGVSFFQKWCEIRGVSNDIETFYFLNMSWYVSIIFCYAVTFHGCFCTIDFRQFFYQTFCSVCKSVTFDHHLIIKLRSYEC